MTGLSSHDRFALFGRGGKGGGGKASAPKEEPDTLRSKAIARIIDVISEGEIYGLADQTNPLKSVYADDVPIQNSDDSYNFEGIVLAERKGTPDQTPVAGFSEVESEVTLNTKVTTASPVVINPNPDIDAIRLKIRIPQLYEQQSDGDLVGTDVNFTVEYKPEGGAWTELLDETIDGKTTSDYERQYRIQLSGLGTDPLIRVVRVTDDGESATLANDIYVSGYTEIIEQKLTYPHTAYVAIEVDSEIFSDGVPARSYDVKGLLIQVPSNYDPETRVYSGLWDGTFQTAWSDNPAWVLYDILTQDRYGLGQFVDASMVDKFALYGIAQFCDELVDDGFGGTEPRFVFNGVINDRRDAFEVINAIVSTFRGMAFWSAGGVTAVADEPRDASRVVGPANVVNGEFNRSSTALKARHNQVLVTWNNPDLNYKTDIEVVEDAESISQYGLRALEMHAFATTSRGQAFRLAKWALDSEKNETETLTYVAGLDHADARPGEIVLVNDPAHAAVRRSGRVTSVTYSDLLDSGVIGTADETWESGDTITGVASGTGGVEYDVDGLFHCVIYIDPQTPPKGVIFELGDSTTGVYLGFDGNGDLVLRAGDGASSPDDTTSARLVIDNSRIPTGRELDLIWDIQINPGRVRLWINNQFFGEVGTSTQGPLEGSVMASTDTGGYGLKTGSGIVAGEATGYDSAFTGELRSDLSYWNAASAQSWLDGLTVHNSYSPGDEIESIAAWAGTGVDRNNNGILWCSFQIATGTTPTGVIFEAGKNNTGAYVGFDGQGDLILRAGDGSASWDPNNTARLVIPSVAIPRDRPVHLAWAYDISDGLLQCWIDHVFYGDAVTGAGTWTDNEWAGSESGSYGQVWGQTVNGEIPPYATAFNGTLLSPLSYSRAAVPTEAIQQTTVVIDESYTSADGDVMHLSNEDLVFPDSLNIVSGTTGTTQYLTGLPSSPVQPNAMYLIQSTALAPEKWRILSVREIDKTQYEVTCLTYDETKYARIEQGYQLQPAPTSFLPTGALSPPSNLSFQESLYKTNNAINTRIDLSWSRSTDPRVSLYRVEYRTPDGLWHTMAPTQFLTASIPNAQAGTWSFRVTALQGSSQTGQATAKIELLNQTIVGKTAKPAAVTGLTATRTTTSATLKWTAPDEIDLIGYEVRQDDAGGSWDTGTVVATEHVSTSLVVALDTTDTVEFFVKSIDSLGQYSVNAASVSTTLTAPSAVTGFYAFQSGSNVRLIWDAVAGPINYEIRFGTTSDTWDSAGLLDNTPATQWLGPFSVQSQKTVRFRIKPYIKLTNGSRYYGSETTFDKTLEPRKGTNITTTVSEHPTWSGTKSASMEVTGSNELALKDGEESGTYQFTVNLGSEKFGRLWYEATELTLSATELEINDGDTVEINDVDFPMTELINDVSRNIDYILEFATEVPFEEADYKFTSVTVRVEFTRNSNDSVRPALSALTVFFDEVTEMV